jgi:hypothetical protein
MSDPDPNDLSSGAAGRRLRVLAIAILSGAPAALFASTLEHPLLLFWLIPTIFWVAFAMTAIVNVPRRRHLFQAGWGGLLSLLAAGVVWALLASKNSSVNPLIEAKRSDGAWIPALLGVALLSPLYFFAGVAGAASQIWFRSRRPEPPR